MRLIQKTIIALSFTVLAACGAQPEDRAADEVAEEVTDGSVSGESAGEVIAETTADAEVVEEPIVIPPSLVDTIEWPSSNVHVKIITNMGEVIVQLYPEEAPQTVENFLTYVRDGHYTRTIFHRVVSGFVVQGGGYNQYFNERPTREPVAYEGDNGLGNYRTTIAMARTRNPNSATSQFYFNIKDNDMLNHLQNDLGARPGYTVFGRIVNGMEVVDRIGAIPTSDGGPFPAEVPVRPAIIENVEEIEWPPVEQ